MESKPVTISYAITVCNESQEFRRLLESLMNVIRPEDEIIVLQDVSKTSEEVNKVFVDFADRIESRVTANFKGNFADWKNDLNSLCTKDYIFQIDADELLGENLKYLPTVLEANSEVDLFLIPRVNFVTGVTDEDIKRWHWNVDQEGRINWPDYQTRIYRNSANIRWVGKVHERIEGYKKWAHLPDSMYLVHLKNIVKQREQNALYDSIIHGK